jgi:hypothetical protein
MRIFTEPICASILSIYCGPTIIPFSQIISDLYFLYQKLWHLQFLIFQPGSSASSVKKANPPGPNRKTDPTHRHEKRLPVTLKPPTRSAGPPSLLLPFLPPPKSKSCRRLNSFLSLSIPISRFFKGNAGPIQQAAAAGGARRR